MSEDDRRRWDERYEHAAGIIPGIPSSFVGHEHLFPTSGRALDVACGTGASSVWLATRGLDVLGVDVSPVAIHRARDLAMRHDVGERCRFEIVDLDDGLPEGPSLDVLVCHLFWDERLVQPMLDRLAPGGLLAVAAKSEVDAGPGRFRVPAGTLADVFASLDILAEGEADGLAWLLARDPAIGSGPSDRCG